MLSLSGLTSSVFAVETKLNSEMIFLGNVTFYVDLSQAFSISLNGLTSSVFDVENNSKSEITILLRDVKFKWVNIKRFRC